jgi:predicted O-methyltransferase YrrM
MNVKKSVKDWAKQIFFQIYKLGTKMGVHILPVNYYSPVPDIYSLKATKDIWAKKSALPGLAVDLDEQVKALQTICTPYRQEYAGNKFYKEGVANYFGQGYGYIEAQALHGIIRHYKPRKIIEVGSGVSTYCMMKALELNATDDNSYDYSLTCIEPYPSKALKDLKNIKLLADIVQKVSFEVFEELAKNDLLFIDSSHTVKPGGDVNFLILEILPRLKPGVIIHFHDIFLPYDYQNDIMKTFFYWSETSLLRAFLINNNTVKILFSLSQLHWDRGEMLSEIFPEYNPQGGSDGLLDEKYPPFATIKEHFPSSIYIQTQ